MRFCYDRTFLSNMKRCFNIDFPISNEYSEFDKNTSEISESPDFMAQFMWKSCLF